jgi:hypothetical protein
MSTISKLVFNSKSADKNAGKGIHEHLSENDDFTELNKNEHWRKQLSNMSISPFTLGGKRYTSVENFFHAAKFMKDYPEFADTFTMNSGYLWSNDPFKAKQAGKAGRVSKSGKRYSNSKLPQLKEFPNVKMRPDFYDGVDVNAMTLALYSKFSQNTQESEILHLTQNAELYHLITIRGKKSQLQRWDFLEKIRDCIKIYDIVNFSKHQVDKILDNTKISEVPVEKHEEVEKILVLCQRRTVYKGEDLINDDIEKLLDSMGIGSNRTVKYVSPNKGADINIEFGDNEKTKKNFIKGDYSVIILNTCPFIFMDYKTIYEYLKPDGKMVISKYSPKATDIDIKVSIKHTKVLETVLTKENSGFEIENYISKKAIVFKKISKSFTNPEIERIKKCAYSLDKLYPSLQGWSDSKKLAALLCFNDRYGSQGSIKFIKNKELKEVLKIIKSNNNKIKNILSKRNDKERVQCQRPIYGDSLLSITGPENKKYSKQLNALLVLSMDTYNGVEGYRIGVEKDKSGQIKINKDAMSTVPFKIYKKLQPEQPSPENPKIEAKKINIFLKNIFKALKNEGKLEFQTFVENNKEF